MQLDGLARLLFIHRASWIPPGELYAMAVVVAREATLWSKYGLSAVPDCDEGRAVRLEATNGGMTPTYLLQLDGRCLEQ